MISKLFAAVVILSAGTATAALIDHGPTGRYFRDTDTGLYWLDPVQLGGIGQAAVARFADNSPFQRATVAELDALLNKPSGNGLTLDTVMGDEQLLFIGSGVRRWVGYHDSNVPDEGYLLQTGGPPNTTLVQGGRQGTASQFPTFSPGGWVHSATDPAAQPGLVNHGRNGEYFFDPGSGLYWFDPAEFEGQSRAQINAFIAANPIWALATAGQLDGLLSKFSESAAALDTVMGDEQLLLTNGLRWVGLYDNPDPTVGYVLQTAGSGNSMLVDSGTQGSIDSFTRGAWLVSSVNPVPEPASIALLGAAVAGAWGLRRRRFGVARFPGARSPTLRRSGEAAAFRPR